MYDTRDNERNPEACGDPTILGRSTMKKFIFAVLALAVAGGSFWLSMYLTQDSDTGAMQRMSDSVVKVGVVLVERRPLRETMEYAGSVEATETVSIASKVTGIVQQITVDLGDHVTQGDTLVVIDDGEFMQRLKQAKANLQLSEAQLERSRITQQLAEREYERAERLAGQGLGTDQAMDSATAFRDTSSAEIDLAKADVARMSAAVEEAQLGVENTRIVSPMDGYVQARRVDPGALASPTMPLLVLVKIDPAKVVVHIPESDILLAEKGREALVSVAGGRLQFNGRVERVAPTLDIATRTTLVEIKVPNADGRLRPGMSADVAIVAREDPAALVVPEDALVLQQDRMMVFVVKGDTARMVPVQIGIQQHGMVQIVEGLEESDLVIVKGQFLVRDGSEVDYEGATPGMGMEDS